MKGALRREDSYTMGKRKKFGVLSLCLLLALISAGCGNKGEEALVTPEAYILGENSAPPFDEQLTEEGGGKLVSLVRQYPEVPEESTDPTGEPLAQESGSPGESPAPEESEQPNEDKKDKDVEPEGDPDRLIYTYAELPEAGTLVGTYAGALTALEDPFQPVDQENGPTDAPDYAQETGTVRMARNAAEEQTLFRIRVDWTPTSCAVTVDRAEGHIEKPQPVQEVEPMTLGQVVSYVEGLTPAILGLEGDSMDQYDVYPMEGISMVNGQACIQFRVYERTVMGTNDVAGIFLITADRMHIYRLNPDTGEVLDQLS